MVHIAAWDSLNTVMQELISTASEFRVIQAQLVLSPEMVLLRIVPSGLFGAVTMSMIG